MPRRNIETRPNTSQIECSVCGCVPPLEMARNHLCQDCAEVRELLRQRTEKRRQQRLAAMRRYYQRNKERIIARTLAYYYANKERYNKPRPNRYGHKEKALL